MKRKIIGVTVGSPLPKSNLKQTDPTKGDYVKGREIIPTKVSELNNDKNFISDTDIDNVLKKAKESGEFDGAPGKDGYTPQKGVDYFDGAPGAAGYTPVKGVDYTDGAPGKDGTSVTVASVSESTEDGGTNVVTFSDGKKLNIKNGKTGGKGEPGKDGKDGKDGSDATVTEASIKSALGYTPADAEEVSSLSEQIVEKEWELIEAITVEDAANVFIRDTEPDGTPYRFKRLRIRVITKANTSADLYINVNNGANTNCGLFINSAGDRWGDITVSSEHGRLEIETTVPTTTKGALENVHYCGYDRRMVASNGEVNKIRWYCATTSAFLAGCTFEIWGVRV